MASSRHEACVIGAGPGGYVAAIRLAQLGKKVVLVDRDRLGGTCLNYGCIPSKALIAAGTLYDRMKGAAEMGITAEAVRLDMAKLRQWKDGVVQKLGNGIAQLIKMNGIELVLGDARFTGTRSLEVKTHKGTVQTVEAEQFIIATGGRPIEIPGLHFDGKTIISSKESLDFDEVPKRLLVVGGGVIGLELGTFFAKVGSQVTVVELMPQLLPGVDLDLVQIVQRSLKKRGVAIHLEAKVKSATVLGDGTARVAVETKKGDISLEFDKVLVCVGVKPNTETLNLEAIGVQLNEKKFIKVDATLRTNLGNVFAIGDVTGGPLLAHRASKQGIVAAEALAGRRSAYDVRAMPGAIFTDPEVATVGMNEAEAEKAGYKPRVGKFPFAASGRALSTGETEGFVKVITDQASDIILGVAIVGPEASNLIAEAALAIEMGATAEDLSLTVHAHPTLPEALMEASEAVHGRAIHIFAK